MARHNLPDGSGYWTDLEGLIEICKKDFELAQTIDKTVNEIDFINFHLLPQFENALKGKISFFPAKMANIKIVEYLKNRITELKKEKPQQKSFHHNLNEENFQTILLLVNRINLFSSEITLEEIKSIFSCSISAPFIVNNNQDLAYLFNCLSPKFIIREWQSVIETHKLFIGKRNVLLKAKNLSKSLNEANIDSPNIKTIHSTISKLSSTK